MSLSSSSMETEESSLPKHDCFVCKNQQQIPSRSSNSAEKYVQIQMYQKLLCVLDVEHQLPRSLTNFQQCCPTCFQSITQICDFHELIQSIQMEMKELVDKLTAASKTGSSLNLDSPTTSTVIDHRSQSDHFEEEVIILDEQASYQIPAQSSETNEESQTDPLEASAVDKIMCKLCGRILVTQARLYEHQRFHENVRRPFQCKLCSNAFYRNIQLTKHMRSKHSSVSSTPTKTFSCSTCLLKFGQQEFLNHHIARKSCIKPALATPPNQKPSKRARKTVQVILNIDHENCDFVDESASKSKSNESHKDSIDGFSKKDPETSADIVSNEVIYDQPGSSNRKSEIGFSSSTEDDIDVKYEVRVVED